MKTMARTLLCGWVLWVATSTGMGIEPDGGFDTSVECRRAQEKAEAYQGSFPIQFQFVYSCFPSGFDPRPRSER